KGLDQVRSFGKIHGVAYPRTIECTLNGFTVVSLPIARGTVSHHVDALASIRSRRVRMRADLSAACHDGQHHQRQTDARSIKLLHFFRLSVITSHVRAAVSAHVKSAARLIPA